MFSQDPPLLIADGMASLRLTVSMGKHDDRSTQFFISGGHCAGLKPANNGGWVLEIVPERGSMTVAITVLSGGNMIEFPLAVVPPLELFDTDTDGNYEAEYVRSAHDLLNRGIQE
jgi:hypothetical protein